MDRVFEFNSNIFLDDRRFERAFQMLEIETAMTDGREHHRFRLPPDVLPTARAAIAEDEARFPAAVLY